MTGLSARALDVLDAGLDDWVSMAEAASILGLRTATTSRDRYRQLLVGLAQELVSSGMAEIGSVRRGEGFAPWDLTETEALDRLARLIMEDSDDWHYGAWFRNTTAGDRAVADRI